MHNPPKILYHKVDRLYQRRRPYDNFMMWALLNDLMIKDPDSNNGDCIIDIDLLVVERSKDMTANEAVSEILNRFVHWVWADVWEKNKDEILGELIRNDLNSFCEGIREKIEELKAGLESNLALAEQKSKEIGSFELHSLLIDGAYAKYKSAIRELYEECKDKEIPYDLINELFKDI